MREGHYAQRRRYSYLSALACLSTIVVSLSMPLQVHADALKCKNLFDLIRNEAVEPTKFFDTFTFKKEGRGDNILLLLKDSPPPGTHVKRWLFLTRFDKDSLDFCVNGQGEGFGQLSDMHDNATEEKFGMPGSGYTRCASFKEQLPPSLIVRLWANRELGPSTIFFTESKAASSFDFLISNDNHWIIIEDKRNGDTRSSCYFDRGSGVSIQQNLTVAKQN